MKRMKWRGLALGLVTTTLGLGIAACDDDSTNNSTDMATGNGTDMSATQEDMATGPLGTGQLVLADLVGTVFSPLFPGGAAPRTHVIIALPALPKLATASDSSSDLNLMAFSGCTINRYTPTNLPTGDGDAGTVTFSGWNTSSTIAVNKKNGSASPGPMAANDPITCGRFPPLMRYTCFFGNMVNTDGGVGAAGALTTDVIFPMMKHRAFCQTSGVTLQTFPDWPSTYPCIERPVSSTPVGAGGPCIVPDNIIGTACEQSPIAPLGVAQITEKMSGGTDYTAAMKTIGDGSGTDGGPTMFPGPLYIVKVESGGTDITSFGPDITGGNTLSFTDGKIASDQALTITFSCDPNNLTKGAACTTSTLAALLIQTDTGKRDALAGGLPSGVGQCIAKPPLGQITISAAQMKALVGSQTTGSIQLALANLGLSITVNNKHTLVFTAGMGTFGFTNQ